MSMIPIFLDLDKIHRLHINLIETYGGILGTRDEGLLESAISQPRAMFAGGYLHEFPFAMAAAYLFHIVQNHPFLDGNKRTGAAAAIVFLSMNDIEVQANQDGLIDITLAAATGRADKAAITEFFQSIAK